MTAGSFNQEDNFRLELYEGDFNFNTDTFVMVLVTATKTPAPATDTTYADISADEVATGNGYTQGGVALTGVSASLSAGKVTINTGSAAWSNFSASFRYAYIIQRAGASLASTDKLVGHIDANTSLAAGTNLTFATATSLTIDLASGMITDTHTP